MALRDDINVPLLLSLGTMTGLLVIVSMIGTEALVYRTQANFLDRRYNDQEKNGQVFYRQVYAPQEKALALSKAEALNSEQTLFRIPLADAERAIIANKGFVPSTQPAR